MQTKLAQKFLFVVVVGILSLGLAGCGDDKYVEGLNPALTTFNAALVPFNAQVDKLNQDNSLLADETWQSDTKSALSGLDKAGKAFASLPEAPERLKTVDGLVKKVAFETNTVVTLYTQLIDNQDMSQLDAANAHVTTMTDLIGQINDAIAEANQ
jgi:hypothetical protein